MKKLLYCLVLISICFANSIHAQQKTPYEKKKEEISIKFLKKMGITQDKINQAKELGDMGLILLMGQAIQNMEAKDPMEALAIMNEFDKEIKATEKLKTEEDFRRERLKQEEKANRIKADQAKYEQQKQLEEKQKEDKRLAEIYNNSDYVTVQKEIKTAFDKWMTKGEYEKTEEYDSRILNKEFVLDSLAYRIITLKMYNILYFKEVVLGQYNADLEIFPLEFKLNNNVSLDSIHVDRNSALSFKENYKYHAEYGGTTDSVITVYRELRNWVFLNNQLFPSRYKINGKKEFVNFPNSGIIKQIAFTTEELGLSNYFINSYTFNAIEYEKNYEKRTLEIRKKKYETLIVEANNLETKNNFRSAIDKFNQAANLFPDSITPKKRIEELNFKINEIKRTELIQEAQQLNSNGKISNSLEKYKEANNIRNTSDVTNTISDIERNLNLAKQNHLKLDSLFKAYSKTQLKVFNDLVNIKQLDLIKDGYGDKYYDCSNFIYEEISKMWEPISNEYYRLSNNRNREIWSSDYQILVDKLEQFNHKLSEYSLFEKRIYKALLASDKKYLKVLKEDDENLIIETVIKTEN